MLFLTYKYQHFVRFCPKLGGKKEVRMRKILCMIIFLSIFLIPSTSKAIDYRQMDMDLNIISGVLQRALSVNNPQGVYLEGYGAIFMCQTYRYRRDNLTILDKKEEIVRIMLAYFPTIRQIKDNDWIVIVFADQSGVHSYQNNNPSLLVKVKYKDIIDCYRQKINREEFLKKVKFIQY
jgi:hypothetical protein